MRLQEKGLIRLLARDRKTEILDLVLRVEKGLSQDTGIRCFSFPKPQWIQLGNLTTG